MIFILYRVEEIRNCFPVKAFNKFIITKVAKTCGTKRIYNESQLTKCTNKHISFHQTVQIIMRELTTISGLRQQIMYRLHCRRTETRWLKLYFNLISTSYIAILDAQAQL